MKTLSTLVGFLLFTINAIAQVALHKMPAKLSAEQARQFIHRHKKVWIDSSVQVGNLALDEDGYYILMAGRTNVKIMGDIVNRGNNFIGNGDISGTIRNEGGYLQLNCININIPEGKVGLDVSGGKVTAQTCRAASGKIALQVRNKAELHVYGGNYRSTTEAHIKQLNEGHLHVYGVGFQISQGIDILILGPSCKGNHYIEACRSETGAPANSVMVHVPPAKQKINVYMRANSYTTGKPTIVHYNARGTLYMAGNCNYSNEKTGYRLPSIVATAGKVVSIANNYGNSLDSNTLQIGGATMESVGDMTRVDQQKEPRTLPIEQTKAYANVKFVKEPSQILPVIPAIQPIGFEPITNITRLGIATAEQFGARTNNPDNSAALTAALLSNKLVLLTGFYKVAQPMQIQGHLGGGLWGIGGDKSGIISTTGTGCINVESMGYSHFRDFSLINLKGSAAPTFNFGWQDKKNSKGGSALQNTVFYNLKIVNGSIGLNIGNKLMGSELWISNCQFVQEQAGTGVASQLNNYNALSDNYIHCTFSGWNTAVHFARGYGNVFGAFFKNVGTAVGLGSQVGNGFLISHCRADSATGAILTTPNSSSRTAVVLDGIKMSPARRFQSAGNYRQGGTVLVQNSDFGLRAFNLEGNIGQKILVVDAQSEIATGEKTPKARVYRSR